MSNAQDSCAGNGAFSTITHNMRTGMHAGDVITISWATRPGCEDQTLSLAQHDTAYDHFVPAETQPLLDGASTPLGHGGQISWTITAGAAPRCHVQLDIITGKPLAQVDTAHRYNKPYFGLAGGNDLVAAAYASDANCGQDATTTTAPTPIHVATSDPIPSTPDVTFPPSTSTTVTDGPGVPTSTPPAVGTPTPYAKCVTSTETSCASHELPMTGADTSGAVLLGGALAIAGIVSLFGQRQMNGARR